MPAKRALVVDDSKSARVVLSRLLEKYGIEVDSAESAETALEYLREHRPDVIFMDHLMPGMDGLQAVREIKANPDLAAIPIMMYTSQEGEIYGGQARASGAVGVLPKSIRPIDVTKALYQLRLLPERRDGEPSGLQTVAGPRAAPAPAEERLVPAQVEAMLKEQHLELRRFVVSTLEAHTHRILSELRPKEPESEAAPSAAPPPPPARPWGWILATASTSLALAVVAVLWWQAESAGRQAERAFEAVTASNESLRRAVDQWRADTERAATSGEGTAADSGPIVLAVPFGEQPLSPVRLEAVRAVVAQLERAAIGGIVRVETYTGSFCLAGAAGQGYSLAPPSTPAAQCEQVGNPVEELQAGTNRQPLAFANLAASVRKRTEGAIEVELAAGPRDRLATRYPAIDQASAGQWNAAAQANNRIEISVVER